MRSDEVYGFLVLRDPERATSSNEDDRWAGPDPRHVEVYSGQAEQSVFRQAVAPLLGAGDAAGARTLAAEFLATLSADAKDHGKLRAGQALGRALRVCALADDAERALHELDDLTALGIDGGGDQINRIHTWRDAIADLLVAGTLSDDPTIDRAAACASICAAESAFRLLARAAREQALPWHPPVFHGVVVLPADLELRPGAGGGAFMVGGGLLRHARFGAENRVDVGPLALEEVIGLSPAELLAQGAVRTFVGDLIVIDQELRSYELGEITHVENVLLTETFARVHRDLKRVEVVVSDTTETETISERDLQSTERDELRSELAKMVQEDIRFGADVSATVSGKTAWGQFGVMAGASFSYNRSSEQREQSAHDHAIEVVDKARQQITERTSSTRSTTTTTEDEDTTTHGFDNKEGDDHVVGVYRWIEKEYDLHLINYGRRAFYEIVLPDPAAYWRALSARRTAVAAGPPPAWPALPRIGGGDPEALGPSIWRSLRPTARRLTSRSAGTTSSTWPALGTWPSTAHPRPPPSSISRWRLPRSATTRPQAA